MLAVYAVGVAEAAGLTDEELATIRHAALGHSHLGGRAGEVLRWVRDKLEGRTPAPNPVLESAFMRVARVVQPLE